MEEVARRPAAGVGGARPQRHRDQHYVHRAEGGDAEAAQQAPLLRRLNVVEIGQATPSFFIPQRLARWFSSLGRIRWPRPCRGRNTTSRPASLPVRKLSEARPNGVLTLTHFCWVKPSI